MAVRKIGAEVVLGNEKTFNDALKKVNSNLKTLRSDMAAVSSEFRENENSIEALTAKEKILQETCAQQKEVVDALTKRHKAMIEKYGEESSQADKARQALNKATVDMHKTQDALADLFSGQREFDSTIEKLNSKIETLGSDMAAVSSEFRENENSIEALTAKQKILQETCAQQKEVVDALTKRHKAMIEKYGEESSQADKARQALNKATVDMHKTQDALADLFSGQREFDSTIEKLNSKIETLGSDMAAVSSEFRENENSIEALTAKQKILQETYEQQKEVVDALTKRHKAMIQDWGEESSQADKARQALNKATVDMNKTQDALDDTSEAIKKQRSLLGRLRKAYEEVPDGAKKAFSVVARGAAEAVKTTTKAGLTVTKGTLKAGLTAAGVLGGVAVAGLTTIGGFATDAAERAKEAYDQANQLAEQAQQAALAGNAEAAAEYQRQASGLMDSVDGDYYRLSQNLDHFQQAQTAAKDAIGMILLPALSELSGDGAALLNEFSEAMTRTGGDTEKMGEVIATYLAQAVELISHKIPDFLQLGRDLLGGLLTGIDDSLPLIIEGVASLTPELVTLMFSLPGKLLDAFMAADVDWLFVGHNIVAGIWQGFQSAWESLKGLVSNALDSLFGSVQAHEEIHSPSRKWDRGVGTRMAQGVGTGFVREMEKIKRDVRTSVDGLIPSIPGGGSPGSPFGAAGGGSTTNMGGIVININGYQIRNDQELAERISYELNQLMNRRGA